MTGFAFNTRSPASYTPPAAPPTLASFIGYWPATLNLLDWTGSDGKTLYGSSTNFLPTNLRLGTQLWQTSGVGTYAGGAASIATTNLASYDGTNTVQKLVEDTSNNIHAVGFGGLLREDSPFHPIPYRLMVIAKAAERTRIVVGFVCPFSSAGSANSTASVGFDLSGGNTGYDVVSGTFITVTNPTMVNLGGGFWACYYDYAFNATAGTGLQGGAWFWGPYIQLDNGSGTAARSTTYTGDGSSGVNICLMSLLPKPLWNSRTRVFFDDFNDLSTIDLNKTKSPSFNWFLSNGFPNSTPAAPAGGAQGFWGNPTPPGEPDTLNTLFSMYQPSIMQMKAPALYSNGSNFNGSLASVVYTSGSGPSSVIGKSWGPPVIFDAVGNVDMQAQGLISSENSLLDNTNIMWSASVETLIGSGLNGSGQYLEIDMAECNNGQTGFATAFDIWDNTGANKIGLGSGPGDAGVIPNENLPTLKRFTYAYIDATSGASGVSGWGFQMGFKNGKTNIAQASYLVYQSSGVLHPGGAAGSGALMAVPDTLHQMLFLWVTCSSARPGPTALWDWVAVWQ